MTYMREIHTINITVNLPNDVQPPYGLPVVATMAYETRGPDGQKVGHPQQLQQSVIPSDITPEVLGDLNAAFAYLGYKLTPIESE